MATFYILFSKSIDRYYVGSSLDLEKRISEHNGLQAGERPISLKIVTSKIKLNF
jgi:predicted GIY-YIG superfamily endonuclease